MPRNIKKINENLRNGTGAATEATARFFDSDITGNGATARGMLHKDLHPGGFTPGTVKCDTVNMDRRRTITGEGSSIHVRPTSTVTTSMLTVLTPTNSADPAIHLPVPETETMFELSSQHPDLEWNVYLNLVPQALMLHEVKTRDATRRHLDLSYRTEVYLLKKAADLSRVPVVADEAALNFSRVHVSFSAYPLDELEDLLPKLTSDLTNTPTGVDVDVDALTTWLEDYNVYEAVSAQAAAWMGQGLLDDFENLLMSLFPNKAATDAAAMNRRALNALAGQIRYYESYTKVPLDSYEKMHQLLLAYCPEWVVDALSKQNINLMLNQTQQELKKVKHELVTVPVPSTPVTINEHFSPQQVEAIKAPGPLDLVQAGAGTGKSTVILGRIDYLTSCGVREEDITVLSFTNVAADNISARNPRVGSMTIARMILEIYEANYSNHRISDIDTIINSLEIYDNSSEFVSTFISLLREVDKSSTGSTTALNSFVEANFDAVMDLLNRIAQTCLELQIIVAYQKIYEMAEPAHIQSKYLIIDEVQDTSIFEFIYMLKYVTKHRQSLFIVGDAAQTLYEFRGANTRALNALEASGIFDTHRLTTNYRSNQSILDFANITLRDIEANRSAQLQLRANLIKRTSLPEFRKAVHLHCTRTDTIKQYQDEYRDGIMVNVVKPYVADKLEKGEQIAFIAYARRDVMLVEEFLKSHFPDVAIASLISERHHPTTVFSQFVKMYWDSVVNAGVANATLVITRMIKEKVEELSSTKNRRKKVSDAQYGAVVRMADDWYLRNRQLIGSWENAHANGRMSTEEFFTLIKENLLQYEIDKNSARKRVIQQRNEKNKDTNSYRNSPFVISTIHGAKGMEFQNVVVVHKDRAPMPEDMKQMYYVALTRAMKTELVISNGVERASRIETDYNNLCYEIFAQDVRDTMTADGHKPDDETVFEKYRTTLWEQYCQDPDFDLHALSFNE